MPVGRVQVIWSGDATAGGGLSSFYFNDAVGTPADWNSAVTAFLSSTNDRRTTALSWVTDADVAVLNVGTGVIESITGVVPGAGTGTAAGDALPPICQGLLRCFTNTIVNGRLLRGRLFLPGTVESDSASTGGTSTTYRGDYEAAAATLIGNGAAEWSMWSRTHGVLANVTTASVWTKFASLRSRRD